MADLSITAGSVVSTGTKDTYTAGGTLTAGLAVRLSSGTVIAATDASAAGSAALGYALNGASSGQPVEVHKGGNINLGATLAVGKVYVLSTDGATAPVDDIATGEYITVMGVAISTSVLTMPGGGPLVSGVAAAGAVS